MLLVACAAVALLSCVVLAAGLWRGGDEPRTAPPAPSVTEPAGPEARAATSPPPKEQDGSGHDRSPAALGRSTPTKVTIPAIDVSTGLEELGLDDDGAMDTPHDPDLAGWYTPGPAPGQVGPAVVAGHVTWNGARAVFYRLSELAPGDTVAVDRADGRTTAFTVDRVEQYPKNEFPTVEVYRNLDHAGLRLITCAGDYSAAEHRYADNVVVYATLTRTTPTA
ncbi:class F sortase [Streptomyces coelicoflavus]|uniref:Class F sortase n=1 Tax=Streptomyces coelicoflavus TaxID=285562 RepID=A0A7K3PM56_9ACTN|nr:class F sortase [Streptomyces coelicoflavus]NEB10349.1 class F sortase [Streptomyces coelicoflavus]